MIRFLIQTFLLSSLGILTGCDLARDAGDRAADFLVGFIPKSVDEEFGRSARERALAGRPVITDPQIEQDLTKLVDPLVEAARASGFNFDVKIVNDPSLNAFALPGGFIYLHSGLITSAGSAREVWGVLAHEMAHVSERHGTKDTLARLGLSTAAMLVMQEAGAVGDVLVRGGMHLAGLKFSRVQESEADETGWNYLNKAGIDPRGMITFFMRLLPPDERQALEKAGTDPMKWQAAPLTAQQSFESMMATHPATGERITAMQQRLKDWDGAARPAPIDFAAFQARVREASR